MTLMERIKMPVNQITTIRISTLQQELFIIRATDMKLVQSSIFLIVQLIEMAGKI